MPLTANIFSSKFSFDIYSEGLRTKALIQVWGWWGLEIGKCLIAYVREQGLLGSEVPFFSFINKYKVESTESYL